MKLYAHFEGNQPFTKVVKVSDDATVADLQEACWNTLQARLPELATGCSACVRLLGSDHRPLPLSSPLSAAVSNGDDVFFHLTKSAGAAPAPQPAVSSSGAGGSPCTGAADAGRSGTVERTVATNSSTPTSPANKPPAAEAGEPGPAGPAGSGGNRERDVPASTGTDVVPSTAQSKRGPGDSHRSGVGGSGRDDEEAAVPAVLAQHVLPLLQAMWQRAEAAEAKQDYRSAAETLQQALLLVPQPSSHPAHLATLVRLAQLWLAAGNPGAAVRFAHRAVEAAGEEPEVLELAGDCLREGGRPREAAMQYQSALEVLQERQDQEAGSSGSGKSASTPSSSSSTSSTPSSTTSVAARQQRLRLSLAACLYELPGCLTPPYNNQDLAASLVMAVLEDDPAHWDALRLYGRIALDRGIRDDALRVALRLVVARPQHRGAKALLAECLQDEASCRQLLEELGAAQQSAGSGRGDAGAGGSTAAALGFVATAIKDHGQVASCIRLLRTAVSLHPRHASYTLNLVHALELEQDLRGAVAAGRGYCGGAVEKAKEGEAKEGVEGELPAPALKSVDTLLSTLPGLPRASDLTWYLGAQPLWAPGLCFKSEEGTEEGGGGGAGGGGRSGAAQERKDGKVIYTPDQLDALALLFTLVKVLFVGGALGPAAALCRLVEPLRRASATELHTTLIRNEAAYFGCVMQLLRDHPPPAPPPPLLPAAAPRAAPGDGGGPAGIAERAAAAAGPKPLYLCGDSHCLSAAWRVVTLRGEQRLLRPLLVTGCKVWHLRPASVFYPKKQFEATMRLLPDGAQVVLVLGEIDCREGLLLAVQKGKYDSVAEGIEATVAIYLDLLRRLVSERHFELFLHPVPPVLNETRHIVTPFAAALRRGVQAARAGDPGLAARLHHLDFFQQLLEPAAGAGDEGGSAGAGNVPAGVSSSAVAGAGEVGVEATACAAGLGRVGAPAEAPGAVSGNEGALSQSQSAVGGVSALAKGAAVGEGKHTAPARADGADGEGGASKSEQGAASSQEAMEAPGPRRQGGEGRAGSVAGVEATEGSRWVLRRDLVFDGTHLSPAYVPLLDAALQGVQ